MGKTSSKPSGKLDLLIVDNAGPGFAPEAFGKPMGGSELEVVLIAEALADRNLSVAVLSRAGDHSRNFVYYRTKPPAEPPRALWIHRTTRYPWQSFDGPIVCRPTDLGWDNYDQELLADERCTLVTVSNWQRTTFHPSLKIAKSMTIPPPMLPIKRRRPGTMIGRNWLYTSHHGKGWAATVEVWKHLKRDGTLPASIHLRGLFPWGELPQVSEADRATYQIDPPVNVMPDDMRAAYEVPDTGALFNVNTFPETRGVAPAWAVYAGLPVHILCKAGLAGLGESVIGPGVTEEWPVFVAGIKAHVRGEPEIYRGKLPDLSAKAMAKQWAEVMGL